MPMHGDARDRTSPANQGNHRSRRPKTWATRSGGALVGHRDGSRSRRTAAGGAGLGLSIVQALVVAPRRDREVRTTPGDGAPFRVTRSRRGLTCRIVRMTATEPAISVVPANVASWDDLRTVSARAAR